MDADTLVNFLHARRAVIEAECQTMSFPAVEELKVKARELIGALDHAIEALPRVSMDELGEHASHGPTLELFKKVYSELCALDPLIQDGWPDYERDIHWDSAQDNPEPLTLWNARVMVAVPDELPLAQLPKMVEGYTIEGLFGACYGVKPHWLQSRNIACGPHFRWVKENIESRLSELEDFQRDKLAKLNQADRMMRQLGVRIASVCLGEADAWSTETLRFDSQSERDVDAYEAQHKAQYESMDERYQQAHKRFSVHDDSDSDSDSDSEDAVGAQDDGDDSD